jgi:hypothetical protein
MIAKKTPAKSVKAPAKSSEVKPTAKNQQLRNL